MSPLELESELLWFLGLSTVCPTQAAGESMNSMKHILFANKTVLVGDAAADALVAYGVALAANNAADNVEYTCIGADGGIVQVSFLLNAGSALVAESTPSNLPEPNNHAEVARIRERTAALNGSYPVKPADDVITSNFDLETQLEL